MENKYDDCIHNRGRKCVALNVKCCVKDGRVCSFYMNSQMAKRVCKNCVHHVDGYCQVQSKRTAGLLRCNTNEFRERKDAK